MAFDAELAERIRELLAAEKGVTEQRMFGGLAFLVKGNMAVAASGQGGLLVHVEPSAGAALIDKKQAEPMVMRGREMQGWLRVDTASVKSRSQLERWVRRGTDHAKSLPPKR